ncbi:unnamed protein product, partial [Rotaria sp. Silwood2]
MIFVDLDTVRLAAKFAVYVATNTTLKTYRPTVKNRPAAVEGCISAPYPITVPIEYHILIASDEMIDL